MKLRTTECQSPLSFFNSGIWNNVQQSAKVHFDTHIPLTYTARVNQEQQTKDVNQAIKAFLKNKY